MNRACLLPLLLVMACAKVGTEGAAVPSGNRDTAQRLYLVAEERYAAGAYGEAVELMRHSLLQLPPSPEHDRLRHQLVLRMGHTQLRDHATTGDAAPLHDAQQMLTRYLERHEALFGDGVQARRERGEVFELLHLVEQRLEPVEVVIDDESDAVVAATTPAGPHAGAGGEAAPVVPEPPAADAAAAGPEPSSAVVVATAPAITTARHVDDEGNQTRDVTVHQPRRLASLDDPRVMERLRSDFSTGWADLVLTAPGRALLHGPRPLVRGISRAVDGTPDKLLARQAGRSLLDGARVDLRSCYEAAFARQPIDALQSTVEASIHPDGSVSHVRIVDGGLIDGYGDACVIEAMEGTLVEPLAETEEPVRVQLALTFFYQGAEYVWETWDQKPPPPRSGGLPPIERLQKAPEPRTVERTRGGARVLGR